MDSVTSVDTVRSFSRKLAPPLVTLLNSEPETQYVALRNINLIVQKRPGILESEIKVRDGRRGRDEGEGSLETRAGGRKQREMAWIGSGGEGGLEAGRTVGFSRPGPLPTAGGL